VSTEPEESESSKNDDALPGADRPRGILTQSDREWLAGDKEFGSRAGLHKARSRVMERLLNGTHDFQYLLNWDEEQRREAFQVEKEGTATYRPYTLEDEIGESIADAVAFYLRTADDAEFPTEELLEAAFVEAQPDVAEANVAVDLRDDEGEVLRTFHIEDGQIVHQESAPGAVELGTASATDTEESEEEEKETEDVGVLEDAYRSAAAAGKQVASTLIEAAFYVYIIAFAWLTYQQYGLGATVGAFTAIGVIIWVLGQLGDWVRGFSDEEDATLLDGVRAALGREDADEDESDRASTDGGVTERTPAQEAA